jgi:hypothetical protein
VLESVISLVLFWVLMIPPCRKRIFHYKACKSCEKGKCPV